MPLMNNPGDVITGGGGTPAHLNGQPYSFESYGRGCWKDDHTIVVETPEGWKQWTPGQTPQPLALGLATAYAGGAGKVIAFHPTNGMFGDITPLPNAGFAGTASVGPDGSYAVITNRGTGYGLDLYAPDGRLIESRPNVAAWDVQVLGNGQAIYRDGGTLVHEAIGRPAPKPAAPDAINVRLTTVNGQDWLTYWSDSVGFCAQLDGAKDGYILGTAAVFAVPDTKANNGQLVIAWSPTEGEASYTKVALDLSQPRVPLVPRVVVPTPQPPAPQPPAPAPTPVPPAPRPIPVPTPFDPSTVTFVDSPADAASWPETATITSVKFDGDRFQVDHTGRDSWADLPFGDGSGGTIQYTLGICAFVAGKWEGAAVVQFWKGRELAAGGGVSTFAQDWFYDGRWQDLKGHQPQPGELVAVYALAGNDRDNDNVPTGSNKQRTNFALVTWGTDYSAAPAPPATPPSQPTDPHPPSTGPDGIPVDLTPVLDALAALKTDVEALKSSVDAFHTQYQKGATGSVRVLGQPATITITPKS